MSKSDLKVIVNDLLSDALEDQKKNHAMQEELLNKETDIPVNTVPSPTDQDIQRKEDDKKSKKTKSRKEHPDPEMQKKLEDAEDKYLRIYSEFDNFRKRTLKEKIEFSKMANAEVITALLPVLDDLERALKNITETSDNAATREGINLIINKMKRILESKGLKEMNATGALFDTDFHEAITNIPAPDEDMKGRIIDEVEKGYLLNDKVIRYAKVVVGN
jgi:molecular chaperone GrpE